MGKFKKIDISKLEHSSDITEIKVSYIRGKSNPVTKLNTSIEAYKMLKTLFNKETIDYREEFFMLLLNRSLRVIGWFKVSEGGTHGTVVDPKIIVGVAIQCNASAILLAHNHPSGRTEPSEEDIRLCRLVNSALRFMEMNLVDSLIVNSGEEYYSMRDNGNIQRDEDVNNKTI